MLLEPSKINGSSIVVFKILARWGLDALRECGTDVPFEIIETICRAFAEFRPYHG